MKRSSSPFLARAATAALLGISLSATAAEDAPRPAELSPIFVAASAYAKIMCSGIFVSGLRESQIRLEDLSTMPPIPVEIDRERRTVTAVTRSARRVARFREGLGCTLDNAPSPLLDRASSPKSYAQMPEATAGRPAALPLALHPQLEKILDHAFREDDSALLKNTRAVLVIHRGKIIGERYADGVTADTPLAGYSMVKGVANLLTGLVAQRGWLTPQRIGLRPEWGVAPADARNGISVDHLLRMTSGLDWSEQYLGAMSDLMTMLTSAPDPAAYAAAKPLAAPSRPADAARALPNAEQLSTLLGAPGMSRQRAETKSVLPGQAWRYSGGSYELLSDTLAKTLRAHDEDPLVFPYRNLFAPLGMTSAVLEAAPNGTFMLSSFMLATSRDWGRLGMFLLDEQRGKPRPGVALPPNWLKDSLRPTLAQELPVGTEIGSGYWLNSLGNKLPRDTFYLGGFQGQFLVVVPERELVVVRLGTTASDGNWIMRKLLEELMPLVD
ncbi:serine hydrolase domain-containing protein [Variovorax boronicumulans]|uniref:serine hydrolase domain-containing protein n=1 Tax=Variovorax boronicumulans TaxID=436515 RepID=UPI003397D3E8